MIVSVSLLVYGIYRYTKKIKKKHEEISLLKFPEIIDESFLEEMNKKFYSLNMNLDNSLRLNNRKKIQRLNQELKHMMNFLKGVLIKSNFSLFNNTRQKVIQLLHEVGTKYFDTNSIKINPD